MKTIILVLCIAASGYFFVSACRIVWQLVTVHEMGWALLAQMAVFLLITGLGYLVIRRCFKEDA
jgi:membrane protein implicated in regulation of membrane protease activity